MNRDDILQEIKMLQDKYKDKRTFFNNLKFKKDLLDELKNLTSFLPNNVNSSQRLYHVINNSYEVGKCTICNTETNFKTFDIGYVKYCTKCTYKDPNRSKNREDTCFKIYGVAHHSKSQTIKNKKIQTALIHYGTQYATQAKEVKNKIRNTNLDKRGVACSFSDPIVQAKSLETLKIKYGVTNASQILESKEKKKKTNLELFGNEEFLASAYAKQKSKETYLSKYGVTHYTKSYTYREDIFKKFYFKLLNSDRLKGLVQPMFTLSEYKGVEQHLPFKCIKCDTIFNDNLDNGHIPRCTNCRNYHTTSNAEQEIFEWLNYLIKGVINKIRCLIPPYELDILITDYNLAIEFNGLYWHSEITDKSRCNKHYHLNKTKMCEEKGIQLIHIFEDEWIDKQEIVKSIIKNKLGLVDTKIYARKCKIKEVSQEEAQNFLFENHLQEPIYSKHNFGLYYNTELVYLICLSKPRFNKKYQFELIRSCSKINTQVIGGFDRLIKYAIRTLDIKSLISYVDRRYFNGSGYKNNWQYVGVTEPGFYYADCHRVIRESRIKYQKHKLKKLFPEYYDDDLSEQFIMSLIGYYRIWDCGNLVFEYKI